MSEGNLSEGSRLRQKAEELLKIKPSNTFSGKSESEVMKLIHDLEVHKMELKIQNEELLLLREQTAAVLEKYINLYNFAPSGYFVLSKEGIILDSNYSGNKMIRQEHQSLINSRFDFFLSDDTKQIFSSFLNKVFASKIRESCIVTLQSDNELTLYFYLTGLLNEKSNDCIVNLVDISNLKKTEEELMNKVNELTDANNKIALQNEEKEKRTAKLIAVNKELEQSIRLNAEKDLFVSILAHDLKGPLSVLIDYSDLVLDKVHEHNINEAESLIRKIKKSTQNTYNLLEDLLKWSKVQSGKVPFEPQKLSFKSICNEVIEILAPNAIAKNIKISFSGSDRITVLADADMLKGVLRNLVSNAIKFTDNNGYIMINAVRSRSDILFSVTDTGTGIKPEHLNRLFDISKFHTTLGTSGEKGTGLGLFLCKTFVEKHGGKIWAESEYGKGSVFYFNIPRKSDTNEIKVISESFDTRQIKDLKILIADDNELLRMVLTRIVKSYSKEVLYAETGIEAVAVYRNNPGIDLILMDLIMPEMNGDEAAREIRMINKDAKIFMQTAFGNSDEMEKSMLAGVDDFLEKPCNKATFDKLMRKHFNKR